MHIELQCMITADSGGAQYQKTFTLEPGKRISIGKASYNVVRLGLKGKTVSDVHGEIHLAEGQITQQSVRYHDKSRDGTDHVRGRGLEAVHNRTVELLEGDALAFNRTAFAPRIVIQRILLPGAAKDAASTPMDATDALFYDAPRPTADDEPNTGGALESDSGTLASTPNTKSVKRHWWKFW